MIDTYLSAISGHKSRRTVESYSRLLRDCFGRLGKTPDAVTPADAWTWAYGVGLSGREPSSATVGARLAALSNFYRFLVRLELVGKNPVEGLERPKARPAIPRGLDAADIRRLLAAIDATTPTGARLRAVVLTLLLTGRRRSEFLNLHAADFDLEGKVTYYIYRAKGGKVIRRELPAPALEAIQIMLEAEGRRPLAELAKDVPICAVSQHAVYQSFRRALRRVGLPPVRLHDLRHAAAKLRRDQGDSIEEVSRFLDHSATGTMAYLLRQDKQNDQDWQGIMGLIT